MFRRFYFSLVVVLAFVCLSCDSVPLLAPTNSSVTIDAQSRVVPTGGTTEVTATVIESSGTPVHNGTLVRFTTTLGRMDPVEAQTRNGIATTTFRGWEYDDAAKHEYSGRDNDTDDQQRRADCRRRRRGGYRHR